MSLTFTAAHLLWLNSSSGNACSFEALASIVDLLEEWHDARAKPVVSLVISAKKRDHGWRT
jgi:hypothetical protein